MIRTIRNFAILVGALALSAATVGCSKKKGPEGSEGVGSTTMEIVLASGLEVRTVSYTISGNGITPRTGTIDVSGQSTTASVLVTGLPPGMGYTAELTATATDGTTMCRGSATFAVVVDQNTSVTVRLDCRKAGTTGGVGVSGTFNTCPWIDSYSVSPVTADVGATITLAAAGHDEDCTMMSGTTCAARQPVTVAWTASAGTVTGTGGAATYVCPSAGTHTLTVTVTDSQCPVTAAVMVNCVGVLCGNGMIDMGAGEECDGAAVPNPGQTCNANCRLVATCGNGFREGSEQCDPPNSPGGANTCSATCQNIPVECGNGLVQPGEACDPPAAGSCSAMCQTIAPNRCGDGMVGGTEECDDGNMVNDDTCDNMCRRVDLCATCERNGWTVSMNDACNPEISGCSLLTGTQRTLCEAMVTCMRTTGCPVNATGDAQACYCGTASDLACLGGAGNGMCKAQAEAAAGAPPAGTELPEHVANSFADPSTALGRAANLMRCDAALCPTQCTF